MKNLTLIFVLISPILLTSCWYTDDVPRQTTKKINNVSKKYHNSKASPFSKDEIIGMQLAGGREKVLKLDCNNYKADGKAYCESEKNELAIISQEITWESVLKKGNQYIATFDCNTIESDHGKKYCLDYKKIIEKTE